MPAVRKRVIWLFIGILCFVGLIRGEETKIELKPDESPQQLSRRILPAGTSLMHPVVSGQFGPVRHSVIMLFSGKEQRGYIGWVLIPQGSEYKRIRLPEREFPASTKVKTIFFAEVKNGPGNGLLFVLCEHISGAGRYPGNVTPFYTTYVYGFDGKGPIERQDIEDRLDPVGQIRTENAVRRKLQEL